MLVVGKDFCGLNHGWVIFVGYEESLVGNACGGVALGIHRGVGSGDKLGFSGAGLVSDVDDGLDHGCDYCLSESLEAGGAER